MKRFAIGLVAAGALGLVGMSSAVAEQVTTPLGTLAVNQDGWAVVADGNSTNPDPFDGYIGVDADGNAQCGDAGGPYNDDGTVNGAHVNSGCNPG